MDPFLDMFLFCFVCFVLFVLFCLFVCLMYYLYFFLSALAWNLVVSLFLLAFERLADLGDGLLDDLFPGIWRANPKLWGGR